MKLGNSDITFKVGSVDVDAIYLGNELVYSGGTTPPTYNGYLRTTARNTGTISFTIPSGISTSSLSSISYSTDETNWTTVNNVDNQEVIITTPSLNSGDMVYWKGDGVQLAITGTVYSHFTASTDYDVDGNIMSLLASDNYQNAELNSGYTNQFNSLFKSDTHVINASGMTLPTTTLTEYCCRYMFANCTNLMTAPQLPATTLGRYCYANMFNSCTSLTTAPQLPATTLANGCYMNMFSDCTSLTTAPQLLATTLANSCYNSMFAGCTSLTTAPSSIGTSATELALNACANMFSGCTSITTAPELPATSLTNTCYNSMFAGCSSLNSITCLATSYDTSYLYKCTTNWTNGVSSNGTFTKASSMPSSMPDGWTSGVDGIPSGWTVVDAT